jgi:hypothetical protein
LHIPRRKKSAHPVKVQIAVVDLYGCDRDRVVTPGHQFGRPHIQCACIVRPQELNSLHRETGTLGELDDASFARQLAARKYLLADELHDFRSLIVTGIPYSWK